MGQALSRAIIEDFYAAYSVRDIGRVGDFLHENVVWSVSGPVDVLPYCGIRRNREEALRVLQHAVPKIFRERRFDVEQILVDGNDAAVLAQLTGVKHDGRVTKFRVAHFLAFRDGRIARLNSVIDSFNAVEQTLGVHLSMSQGPAPLNATADFVRL